MSRTNAKYLEKMLYKRRRSWSWLYICTWCFSAYFTQTSYTNLLLLLSPNFKGPLE